MMPIQQQLKMKNGSKLTKIPQETEFELAPLARGFKHATFDDVQG